MLLENELFGSAAGAHSAANVAREGKVAAAHGGTLFLDEIGELSLSGQSKLLQLLQSGTYYALGSTTARRADVRVIAATNRDLQQAIVEKTFREDLFYRLNVLPIRSPTLAERTEDIALLAEHFVARASANNELPLLALSPAARVAVETAEWPGNVRQLANAIEAAVLRAAADEGASSVAAHHVFPEIPRSTPQGELTYQEQLHQFRRQVVMRTLDETGWNVAEAARRLDVARSYLNRLIRSLAIQRE
jgi:Nif-specific regulatory protein